MSQGRLSRIACNAIRIINNAVASGLTVVDLYEKKETLNFRVAPEFKRRLIEEANKQRRSLTNYLEATLMEVWEKQETAPDNPVQKRKPQRPSQ